MGRLPDTAHRQWRDWSVNDWNRALFEYFFEDSGDHASVSRIVINNDILRRVAGEGATADEAYTAFRKVVCESLDDENLASVIDWFGSESRFDQECPGEFVYLAVTCYAATHAVETGEEGNFRRRLKEFLGLDTADQNYWLNSLPSSWKRFQTWLDHAIEAGRPIRRLILNTPPSSRRLIGHSLGLAFPSHRDHLLLVQYLAAQDLSESPPILRVLQIINRRLNRFSDAFQTAFRRFRTGFESRQADLHESPFWSAVREAIVETYTTRQEQQVTRGRVMLRLDREDDWHFGVSVFLDCESEPSITTVPAHEYAVGDFRWVVSDVAEASCSPGEWVIEGRAHETMLCHTPAFRGVIDAGVLLFEPNEDDVWLLKVSIPKGDRIRALVRRDVVEGDRVIEALNACGAERCNSRYANWFEIDGLSRAGIDSVNLGSLLPDVDVLQPTVEEPVLRLHGGVRTDSSWLGWRSCLPKIVTQATSARITAALTSHADETECLESERPGTYAFPEPNSFPLDLDGDCVIRARMDGRVVRSKSIRFDSRVLSCDYRDLTNPTSWLCEGGTVDVGVVDADLRVPDEIASEGTDENRLIRGVAQKCESYVNDERVNSLIEILAGRSLRRGLLNASEVVNWFNETLQLGERNTVWRPIRSWVEAGVLDHLVHRSWRCTAFRARRPRFVVTRGPGKRPICAVLQGLAPSSIEEAIRRASQKFDVEIERHTPLHESLPAPLMLFATKVADIVAVSHTASLGGPEIVCPIDRCLCAADHLEFCQSTLRRNHVPNGEWSWEHNFFTAAAHSSEPGVKRYRREDCPDSYQITAGDAAPIHTLSKTWALLIGATVHEQGVFAVDRRSAAIHVRKGLHLPLPAGRWATATTGVCPGWTDQGDYEYRFPNEGALRQVLDTLWKRGLPEELRRRIQHIEQLCGANRFRDRLVAVPRRVTDVLRLHESEIACPRLMNSDQIPRRLLPQLLSVTQTIRSYSSRRGPRG